MTIKLIVALGNPGQQYTDTRHNIAWKFLDKFLEQEVLKGPGLDLGAPKWISKFQGSFVERSFEQQKILFVKPQTYMNLSGRSVTQFISFYKIKPEEMLVVQDEVDLPFGTVFYKKGGGLAGHNGLKSIVEHLKNPEFYRLRLGVGRPTYDQEVSQWVLSAFSKQESSELENYLEFACKSLNVFLQDGITKASAQFNRKSFQS